MKDVLLKTLLLDNMFGLILIIWFTFDVVTKKMIIPNLREKKFEKMTPEMVDNREQVYAKKGDYVKVEYLPNTRRGTVYY